MKGWLGRAFRLRCPVRNAMAGVGRRKVAHSTRPSQIETRRSTPPFAQLRRGRLTALPRHGLAPREGDRVGRLKGCASHTTFANWNAAVDTPLRSATAGQADRPPDLGFARSSPTDCATDNHTPQKRPRSITTARPFHQTSANALRLIIYREKGWSLFGVMSFVRLVRAVRLRSLVASIRSLTLFSSTFARN